LALAWTCAAAAGCAGYRLGSTLPPGLRSVHVPVFVNRTAEPQLENDATQAAMAEFQKDGTLRVAPAAEADAVLEVELTAFGLEPLRYDRDRAKTAVEYRARISARLVFKENRTGEVLMSKTVEGESTFVPTGDLSTAKRTAIPAAAADLAHDIVEAVVEYW
jgi:hypothetical protein